jgi:hypothetical protein
MIDRDPLLDRVIAELKQPVEVDPAARRGLLDAALAGSRRRLGGALLRRPAAVALAAAAGIVLAVLAWPGAGREPGERWTMPVRFALAAPAARGVALVGDFNDWDRDATPLEPSAAGNEWSVTVRLAPGRYTYAFVVDGTRWVPDPSAPRAPDDGFGIPTSVILVPEGL